LDLLARELQPGITTTELDERARQLFHLRGASSAPARVYGFPGTVLISINDEIVHGVPGPRRVAAGDLVSLDVTVELGGYVADAARSVVVRPGTDTAHRLVACARAAFDAALDVARAGVRVSEIGRAVQNVVKRHGFSVIKELAGHGVGRTLHEPPTVPNEWDPSQTEVLTEGLVITIEPMIAVGSGWPVEGNDGWTVRTRDRSLAAHHEDTLVITRSWPVVLTGEAT
jgi:methionyl aminopeptidase